MKKANRFSLFLPVLLLVALMFVNYSCEGVDEEQCETEEVCEANFSFCSSSDSYYYQLGDDKYYCETPFVSVEESCEDAMHELIKDMCDFSASVEAKSSMVMKTQKLMDKILLSVSF